MPSASLQHWNNDRLPRLNQLDTQCAAVVAATVPKAQLIDEILRAYVLALCAHFQGFCRDLYTECAQITASRVRPSSLQPLMQALFTDHRKLDHCNPNVTNLKADFA